MSSNSRPWSIAPTDAKGEGCRRAFTFVEVIVSFCLAFLLFAFAHRLVFTKRKSVEVGERIDDLRCLREITMRVERDLATAARILSPAWDTAAFELKLLDGDHRAVQVRLRDEQGRPIQTPEELARAERVEVFRRVAGDAREERLGRSDRLSELRFTRLGRDLVGLDLRFHPVGGGRKDDPGLRHRSIVTMGRRVE